MGLKICLTTLPQEGEVVSWQENKKIYPKQDVVKYMPLGILSLATNLPKEHEVILLDPPTEGWSIDKTIQEIEKINPVVLGISAITRRHYAMCEVLKRTTTKYKFVGGPHTSNYFTDIQNRADRVFVGQLVDKEFSKAIKDKSFYGITICNTKINEIKFPNRKLLDVNKYFYKGKILFKTEKRLSMFSSVGCPHNCTFCNVQHSQIQFKNPKIVVDEMEHLIDCGAKSIHILDDNFTMLCYHIKGILNEIEKRKLNIEWSCRGQVRMDLSLVKRMKKLGLKRIHVGFEALNNNILSWFNKPQTMKEIRKFCYMMNKNDVEILAYFILGTPLETKGYRNKFFDKIKKLKIKYPFFNILFPEPNTQYYQSLLKDKIYKRDYWKEFIDNPTPNFQIPYPYGKKKKEEVLNYVDSLVEEFKK